MFLEFTAQSKDKILSLSIILSACFAAAATTACGSSNSTTENNAKDSARVRVLFARNTESQKQFGLTGMEPAFIGLGIEQEGQPRSSVQLLPGENLIELKTLPTRFKASLIMHRPFDNSKLYYSTAAANLAVNQATDSVELVFSPLQEAQKTGIFGLAYQDDGVPASGAQIQVVEPYSGAVINLPDAAQIAEADARGVFAFNYFYNLPGFANEVTLRVLASGNEKTLNLPIGEMKDGWSALPFVNLLGSSNTSPFAIDRSLLKGDKGDKGEKGEKGDKGDKGEPGLQGVAGPAGAPAPAGSGTNGFFNLRVGDTLLGQNLGSIEGGTYLIKTEDFMGKGPGYFGAQNTEGGMQLRQSDLATAYKTDDCTGQGYQLIIGSWSAIQSFPFFTYLPASNDVFKISGPAQTQGISSFKYHNGNGACLRWQRALFRLSDIWGEFSDAGTYEMGGQTFYIYTRLNTWENGQYKFAIATCNAASECFADAAAWKKTKFTMSAPVGPEWSFRGVTSERRFKVVGNSAHALLQFRYDDSGTIKNRFYYFGCVVNSSGACVSSSPVLRQVGGDVTLKNADNFNASLVYDGTKAHLALVKRDESTIFYGNCTTASATNDCSLSPPSVVVAPSGYSENWNGIGGRDGVAESTLLNGTFIVPVLWNKADSGKQPALLSCQVASNCNSNWVANGLSSVSPSNSTLYDETFITPVKYSDRFALAWVNPASRLLNTWFCKVSQSTGAVSDCDVAATEHASLGSTFNHAEGSRSLFGDPDANLAIMGDSNKPRVMLSANGTAAVVQADFFRRNPNAGHEEEWPTTGWSSQNPAKIFMKAPGIYNFFRDDYIYQIGQRSLKVFEQTAQNLDRPMWYGPVVLQPPQ